MTRTLIIFAREPVAGRTKTRLCPPFDQQTAAALYSCFLRDITSTAASFTDVQATIAYTPDSNPAFFDSFAPKIQARPQCGKTLGERMDNALRQALQAPSTVHRPRPTVLIGSDSPDLPASFIYEAFARLADGVDVVLGPASDGGYYMIGVREPQPRLLRGVPMSTPTVLADTVAIAEQLELRVQLLPVWYDIDTAEDVSNLVERLRGASEQVAPATRAFLAQLEAFRLSPRMQGTPTI